MTHPAKTNQNLSWTLLFAGTLFVSASLMFVLQPLFGKILLPLLGGSPAVWNTCMVFYQTILFLGYLYAHTVTSRFKPARQIQLHTLVILLSCLALPLALPENTVPPTESNPTLWIVWTLIIAIGLPLFVVSTTSPLIQKWFASLDHKNSDDPYFLYAASNAGSLIALISYPFLIEPNIDLSAQKTDWSLGYVLLCTLIASCAYLLYKSKQSLTVSEEAPTQSTEKLPLITKLYWLALAFVPSSLLIGLTNFISTDIASVPLLWIIPLTVYLLSFIIVFSSWNDATHPVILRLQPLVLIPFITYAFINPADLPYWGYLILHVIAFFFSVMVCHGELSKHRPATQHLTSFYLIMSFGGMLGGMFNTFVAPFIFNGIYEYPLMIIAALLLRPRLNAISTTSILLQLLFPTIIFAVGISVYFIVEDLLQYFDIIVISLIIITFITFALRQKTVAFAFTIGAVIFLSLSLHGFESHTLYQERTFFGVLAVRESVLTDENNQDETYHVLVHGTTKHGAQRLPQNLQEVPLTYYSRPGPIGQLFKEFDNKNANWNIGVVGLGAGALNCYAKATQQWTLYEIDPLVVDIANTPEYFTYMKLCAHQTNIQIGDARLSIDKEPDGQFDLLIMDAFSSDAVPTHLITKEALDIYFKKLKPNGILAFHMTNRHLALKKVLSIHAEKMHLTALIQEYRPQNPPPLVVATDWVVMTKNPETLAPLSISQFGNWEKMPLYFDMKPWTDDFTNIISIWK
ncbi:MAG: fused MFS/spermidine synthase [Methylococcales bacterium]|nr:fused MFS/spermidine synthase [Methylococcales bacterium]